MGIMTNSKDPDKMLHNVAFHQGLHCFAKTKMIFKERNSIFLSRL